MCNTEIIVGATCFGCINCSCREVKIGDIVHHYEYVCGKDGEVHGSFIVHEFGIETPQRGECKEYVSCMNSRKGYIEF
jgi:hypothetical protein